MANGEVITIEGIKRRIEALALIQRNNLDLIAKYKAEIAKLEDSARGIDHRINEYLRYLPEKETVNSLSKKERIQQKIMQNKNQKTVDVLQAHIDELKEKEEEK